MTQSTFQAAVNARARAIFDRYGPTVDCTYQSGGTGTAGVIKPRFPKMTTRAVPIDRAGNATKPVRRTELRISVPAFSNGEIESPAGSGVGNLGGVIRLKTGDTIVAPGHVANRPDLPTVTLRVGDDVNLVENAYWSAGVSL